ncbi:MAG: asparagine synthetase B, partial [Candidatus Marinimicrobia bacterium]|nr:asparagine synthetase B [Candidatus Neomarinimicrobiota bacterium]
MMQLKQFFGLLLLVGTLWSQKILIPMDETQTDHLKAYGVAFWVLERDIDIEWLLNYRGGSFLIDQYSDIVRELRLRDVKFETAPPGAELNIYASIESGNMDIVLLEKAPKVAVYSPPGKQPWDDAVT